MERLQFNWAALMVLIGTVGAVAVYLALRTTRREKLLAAHPGLPGEKPVPPVLWLVYLGTAAIVLSYVVWAWLVKPNY